MRGDRRSGSAPRQLFQRRSNKANVSDRPAWDDTTGDLDKWKLTPEQLNKRKAQRVSKNRIALDARHTSVEDWAKATGVAGSPNSDDTSRSHARADDKGGGGINFGAVLQMLQRPPPEDPPAALAPKSLSFEELAAEAAASMAEAASRLPLELTLNPRYGLRRLGASMDAEPQGPAAADEPGAMVDGELQESPGIPAPGSSAAPQLPASVSPQLPAGVSHPQVEVEGPGAAGGDDGAAGGAYARRHPQQQQQEQQQGGLGDRLCRLEERAAESDELRSEVARAQEELRELKEESRRLRQEMSEFSSHTSVLMTFLHSQLTRLVSLQGLPVEAAGAPEPQWWGGLQQGEGARGTAGAGLGQGQAGMGPVGGGRSPERLGRRPASSWMFRPVDEAEGLLQQQPRHPAAEAAAAGVSRGMEPLDDWVRTGGFGRPMPNDPALQAAAPQGRQPPPSHYAQGAHPAAGPTWTAAPDDVLQQSPGAAWPPSSAASVQHSPRQWPVKDIERDLDALPSYAAFRRSTVVKAVTASTTPAAAPPRPAAAAVQPVTARPAAAAVGQPELLSAGAAAASWTPAGAGRVRAAMAHTAAASAGPPASAGLTRGVPAMQAARPSLAERPGAPPPPAAGAGYGPEGQGSGPAAARSLNLNLSEAALGSPPQPSLHLRPLPTEFQPRSLGHASILVQSHLGGLPGPGREAAGGGGGRGAEWEAEMEEAAWQALGIEQLGLGSSALGGGGVAGEEAFGSGWGFEQPGPMSPRLGVAASSMSLSAHAAAAHRLRSKRASPRR